MKLHIGCGKRYLPGYKHLDIISYHHVDYVANADDLYMIEENSVEEIYACHILEHFKRFQINKVIREWKRVLIPGGVLRIAVPDFESIVKEYSTSKSLDKLLGLLFGGQTYDYNFHHMIFDFKYIENLLKEHGFANIRRYDWKDFLPKDFDDFSRAYIPHMDTNGRLMSLNVIARRE